MTAIRILTAVAGLVLALATPWMREGGGVLDGFVIGHVPRDAGSSVSDFEYEPEDGVRFTSRVWERETETGGHAVDLEVVVMRADRFAAPRDLRDYMAEYHERDAGSWTKVQVGDRTGFASDGHVFWLASPGVGVSVDVDARFGPDEPMAVAEGVRDR